MQTLTKTNIFALVKQFDCADYDVLAGCGNFVIATIKYNGENNYAIYNANKDFIRSKPSVDECLEWLASELNS